MTTVLDNLPLIREYGSVTTPLFWIPSGKLFYSGGTPITVKGYSAFKAIEVFSKENKVDYFNQWIGYNNPRVFTYTEWGNESWDFPSNDTTLAFIEYCNSLGLTPSICLLTDANPSRIQQAINLVNFLKGKQISLMLEAVNEPGIHDKTDPSVLRETLEQSGFPYASGWYTDTRKHYGNNWVDHSSRGAWWECKGGHNCYEASYAGGGPNDPSEPKLNQPAREDEPIRFDEAGYDYIKFYSYAASCVLLGAGATAHSTPGKYCSELTSGDKICRDYFLRGLNVFPPITDYHYNRIVEPGQEKEPRTYVNGNYAIRISQKGTSFPESGWKPLDEFGICWIRG